MDEMKYAVRLFFKNTLAFDLEGVGDGECLIENGALDSIGVVELAEWMKEGFGVNMPQEDMVPGNLGSVESIAAYITRARTDQFPLE